MELPSFYRTFAKNILRHDALSRVGKTKPSRRPTLHQWVLLLVSGTFAHCTLAVEIYSQLQLKQDVTHFLATEYKQIPHARIDISVGNLDSRLRLVQCPVPLEFSAQDQTGLGGNISVRVQCASQINWKIQVPAQVMVYQQVPVAAQDIGRGQAISSAHLGNALVNISNLRQAFAADQQNIIGREAKRNIGKGEVFKIALLDAPTAIRRGDVVMVEAITGSIKVSSSGTAMGDGRLGQKVRIMNGSSARIVTGIVRGQGLVQIL